jgi:hypothetical protein
MMRTLTCAALLLAALAGNSAAQQAADTVLTPEQRALERLRALGAVAQPDTARAPVDTVRSQRVNVHGGAGAPERIQRDSIMNLLVGVPDYVATEYRGDSARFQADINRLELRGKPQVSREGSQLVADSLIVYDEAIARACGYGQPVLHAVGMQNPLVSDTVCFDVQRQVGYARGAQTTVAEGATWHMRGDVYFQGDDFYSHRAIFTDCDLPWPHQHYHFGARELKVVRDNVLVARDVTINFEDVPVFWLPFMVQSLSSGRRSGILMPRFGINDIARTSSRYSRKIEDVGMYWAVNDYLGGELAMDWFSNNWTAVRGSFDYNFPQRFLRGGLTYRYFWPEEGGRQFTLAAQNAWQVDERTNLNVNANYASSAGFVQQRSFDPRELNRSIDSNVSLARRFDWGRLSTNSSRRQQLSDGTVTWVLPAADLSFSPVTLFEAMPGEESWFSNMTISGNSRMRMERTDIGAENFNPNAQSRRNLTSGAQASLSLGNFSLSQNLDFNERVQHERIFADTLVLPGQSEQRGSWSSSLSFQQRLMGTSTFTPSVSIGGDFARTDATANELLHAPTRVDFSAALRTDVFGFYRGVGAFDRFRHRISPSISYSYSPELKGDSLQRDVFSVGAAERNGISLGLSQTWEARYRGGEDDRTVATDTAADRQAGAQEGGQAEGQDRSAPRRQTRAQTVTLLSISTDALMYDFVRAREEGRGLTNTQLSNSVHSDLLRGLQLRFTHDLFRNVPGEGGPGIGPGTSGDREFAPHLSQVNASFSLNGDSWLFRVLGLGRGGEDTRQGGAPLQDQEPSVGGPATDRTDTEFGMVGTSRRTMTGSPRQPVGAWNASITYTMFRPREEMLGERENQRVSGNLSFQPTQNWRATWNTGYTFGGDGFTDHILTLTRQLHDWDANFDFVRAQNGNFSFQFRVHLRANPDIKLDYSQSDAPGIRRDPLR